MIYRFFKGPFVIFMIVSVAWNLVACRSVNENDTSNLKSYEVHKKVPFSDRNLSVARYRLFGPIEFHIMDQGDYSGDAELYVLCVFSKVPAVKYKRYCINPFRENINGSFKNVTFDDRELGFLKDASDVLSKEIPDPYSDKEFLNTVPGNDQELRKAIAESFLHSHHGALVYEMRHSHRRLVKVSGGVTLKKINTWDDHVFTVNNFDEANNVIKNTLQQLSQLIATVKNIDLEKMDYCYPVVVDKVNSLLNPDNVFPEIFLRCASGLKGPVDI